MGLEELSEVTGAAVFLETPLNVNLGADYTEWKHKEMQNSGDVWVISGLTPGPHIIYWTNDERRIGQFVHLAPREVRRLSSSVCYFLQVCVFKWSKPLGLFVRVYDTEEIERYQCGHDNLSLLTRSVIYPTKWISPWTEVTFCISRYIVDKIIGPIIRSDTGEVSEYSNMSDFDGKRLKSPNKFGRSHQRSLWIKKLVGPPQAKQRFRIDRLRSHISGYGLVR